MKTVTIDIYHIKLYLWLTGTSVWRLIFPWFLFRFNALNLELAWWIETIRNWSAEPGRWKTHETPIHLPHECSSIKQSPMGADHALEGAQGAPQVPFTSPRVSAPGLSQERTLHRTTWQPFPLWKLRLGPQLWGGLLWEASGWGFRVSCLSCQRTVLRPYDPRLGGDFPQPFRHGPEIWNSVSCTSIMFWAGFAQALTSHSLLQLYSWHVVPKNTKEAYSEAWLHILFHLQLSWIIGQKSENWWWLQHLHTAVFGSLSAFSD